MFLKYSKYCAKSILNILGMQSKQKYMDKFGRFKEYQ